MSRATRTVLAAAFAVCVAGALVWGDGMVLPPPYLLQFLSEENQLAAIEVAKDHTVHVDLFISLMDTSGASHDFVFLLPLQTLPTDFRTQEVTAERFRDDRLQPLIAVLRSANDEREREGEHWLLSRFPGAVAAGPLAFVIEPVYLLGEFMTHWNLSASPGASAFAVRAVASMRTEHSRVDIYPALRPDEMAQLAGLPKLAKLSHDALQVYAGRPFALVRLRTVERRKATGTVGGSQEKGVHFSFGQGMRREGGSYRYDFPLGTGRGWANPIANTAVYVGAEDGLHLEVEAPGKARLNARPDRGLALRAISFNAGAAGGRQVYSAIYSRQQPERDLIVRVFDRGRSEWVQDARGRQGRIIGWYAGFLLIGAAAWVVAVALTLSPKVGGSRQVLWRVAATSWLLAGIPVLAMLVAIAVLWLLVIAGSEGTAEAIILALGISAFLAMAAAPVMRFYDRHVLTQQAGWPWATVALSALIYFVVRHTMEWGWPWVAAALAALTYFIVRHVMKRSGWPTPPASPLALRPPGLE